MASNVEDETMSDASRSFEESSLTDQNTPEHDAHEQSVSDQDVYGSSGEEWIILDPRGWTWFLLNLPRRRL